MIKYSYSGELDNAKLRDIVQKDSVWGLFDYGGVEKGGLNCWAWPNRKIVILEDHKTLS